MSAIAVDEVASTETEKRLEDILVASPDLLELGLKLIGRQVPIEAGVLDLLGVDQNGRLTVFELKRGMLTREAVAQSLDYAANLEAYQFGRLAELVQRYSGRYGIDKIDNFEEWYSRRYSGPTAALSEELRIVLVGLEVDESARRIVPFLADRGTEIQVVLFYGFRRDGQLFLARVSQSADGGSQSSGRKKDHIAKWKKQKKRNLEQLRSRARKLKLLNLLEQVRGAVEQSLSVRCWPAETFYAFSLRELTDDGQPTSLNYVTLHVLKSSPPRLSLRFYPRATSAAGSAATEAFMHAAGGEPRKSRLCALEVPVSRHTWETTRPPLTRFLAAVDSGWHTRMTAELRDISASSPEQ